MLYQWQVLAGGVVAAVVVGAVITRSGGDRNHQGLGRGDEGVRAGVRSPLAMKGEVFERPIGPRVLAEEGGAEEVLAKGAVVPWGRAGRYVGRRITVEGEVVATRGTGEVCFLNFDRDWRGSFYVVLFEDVLDVWPGPAAEYFLGKTVRVTGTVRLYEGRPQIGVLGVEQVRVVRDGVVVE